MPETERQRSSDEDPSPVRAAALARVVEARQDRFREMGNVAGLDQLDAELRDCAPWALTPRFVAMSPDDLSVFFLFTVGAVKVALVDGEAVGVEPPTSLRDVLVDLVDRYLAGAATKAIPDRLEQLETAWNPETAIVTASPAEATSGPRLWTVKVGDLVVAHVDQNTLFVGAQW